MTWRGSWLLDREHGRVRSFAVGAARRALFRFRNPYCVAPPFLFDANQFSSLVIPRNRKSCQPAQSKSRLCTPLLESGALLSQLVSISCISSQVVAVRQSCRPRESTMWEGGNKKWLAIPECLPAFLARFESCCLSRVRRTQAAIHPRKHVGGTTKRSTPPIRSHWRAFVDRGRTYLLEPWQGDANSPLLVNERGDVLHQQQPFTHALLLSCSAQHTRAESWLRTYDRDSKDRQRTADREQALCMVCSTFGARVLVQPRCPRGRRIERDVDHVLVVLINSRRMPRS